MDIQDKQMEWPARIMAIIVFAILIAGINQVFSQEPIQAERWKLDTITNTWNKVLPYETIPDKEVDANIKMDFGDCDVKMDDFNVTDLYGCTFNFYTPNGEWVVRTTLNRLTRVPYATRVEYLKGVGTETPFEFKFAIEIRRWWFWRFKRVVFYEPSF